MIDLAANAAGEVFVSRVYAVCPRLEKVMNGAHNGEGQIGHPKRPDLRIIPGLRA